MGCDIHLHVEIRLDGSDEWVHWNAPKVRRRYPLFAKMAGVRNYDDEIRPIALPRGVPSDWSAPTRWDCKQWGTDGHSHSWLSRDEIGQLQAWWEEADGNDRKPYFEEDVMGGYLAGNGYTHELPKGVSDVRIVFWFDN